MDQNRNKKEISFVIKASAAYYDKFPLRSAIQGIPGLGGALDTMLAGLGAKYQYKRLEDFIINLNKRLEHVEERVNIEPSEPLFDLMMHTFDQVRRTRSEEKRKQFANLIANQVTRQCDWNDAETACRLLGDLTELHIETLSTFVHAKINDIKNNGELTISDKWSDRKVFDKNKSRRKRVSDIRPHLLSLTNSAILMICSELVSKGLLYDAGVGRMDVSAMEIFVATDFAQWLMDWISDSQEE